CPVPYCDHDVPLLSLRTRRSSTRQLSVGNPVGPVRVHRRRALTANLVEACSHTRPRLAGLNAALPGGFRVRRVVEDALGNFARGLVTHLMAASVAICVDDLAYPLALALNACSNTVPARPRAGQFALGRYPPH